MAAGGQQKWVRQGQPVKGLGSGPFSRLWEKAVEVTIQGLGQWSEVAFAKETVNCYRLEFWWGARIYSVSGQNISKSLDLENSVS